MSYWVELHCDEYLDCCCSRRNENQMDWAPVKRTYLLDVYELNQQAIKAGWVRTTRGWSCPSCQKKTLDNKSGAPTRNDRDTGAS